MRTAVLILFSTAALGGGVAFGQGASTEREGADESAPDEVVVRGRRLTDLRFEVEQAQERAYAIFNELNSDDDFDVYCREERRHHSRATQRVCRAQFESRISSSAAGEYLAGLFSACRADGGVTQECMFSNYGAAALSAAHGVEGQLPSRQAQMTDEILRLARENDQFAQAILDWYETTEQYEAARKRRRED
jgi:hypothetical protein